MSDLIEIWKILCDVDLDSKKNQDTESMSRLYIGKTLRDTIIEE